MHSCGFGAGLTDLPGHTWGRCCLPLRQPRHLHEFGEVRYDDVGNSIGPARPSSSIVAVYPNALDAQPVCRPDVVEQDLGNVQPRFLLDRHPFRGEMEVVQLGLVASGLLGGHHRVEVDAHHLSRPGKQIGGVLAQAERMSLNRGDLPGSQSYPELENGSVYRQNRPT